MSLFSVIIIILSFVFFNISAYAWNLNNKKKRIIRVLDDGFWLLEDFWRIQHAKTVLDMNSNSGWMKGFSREYEKHNIDPKSILGIHKVIYPKVPLKKG